MDGRRRLREGCRGHDAPGENRDRSGRKRNVSPVPGASGAESDIPEAALEVH